MEFTAKDGHCRLGLTFCQTENGVEDLYVWCQMGITLTVCCWPEHVKDLMNMFVANFEKFEPHVEPDVLAAAPSLREAAE